MQFNIIGAGRLGKNLASSMIAHGHHQLMAVCNSNLPSAIETIASLGQGQAVAQISLLPAVALTFITTPDDAIADVVALLVNNAFIAPGSIVAHCSGALSSDLLQPLRAIGCKLASIHPLKAFRVNDIRNDSFCGCPCVIEGDIEAVKVLTTVFMQMEARVIPIDVARKNVYHAAAVMASNYIVTLANCARELLSEAGLTSQQAQQITHYLMTSSLTNLQHTENANQALTGPLSRGDLKTISQHLQAVTDPCINALYRSAALATIPLTNLKPTVEERLIELLKLDHS